MPLDPRIPLGVQAPQIQSPVEAITAVAQLQGIREQTEARRLAADEARQKAKDAAQVRQILTESGGDLDLALPRLRAVVPKLAGELETERETAKKERYAGLENQMQARVQGLTFATQIASIVDSPAKAQAVRPFLHGISDEFKSILPQSDDPAEWQTFVHATLTAKDRMELARADLKLLSEGHVLEAVASSVSRASSQEDLDAKLKGFRDLLVPEGILTQFGTTWDPEYGARAAQLAITPTKRAELEKPPTPAYQQKDVLLDGKPAIVTFDPHSGKSFVGEQDVTARVQPIPPQGPGPERIVSVIGPDGQPVYVRESQAVGQRPVSGAAGTRAATEGERKAAGFHGQMQQALTTINQLESQLTERDLYQIQSLPQEGITGAMNRGLMSDAAKRYIQAFNQFTEARLRPVSGAAIAASEYERDRATYGKQYAETPTLAEQRQAARAQALEALRVMGGSAIEERAPASPPPPPPPGETRRRQTYAVGQILTVKGQKVRVTKLLPNGQYEGEAVP